MGSRRKKLQVSSLSSLLATLLVVLGGCGEDPLSSLPDGEGGSSEDESRAISCSRSPEFASDTEDTTVTLVWSSVGAQSYDVLLDTVCPPVKVEVAGTEDTSVVLRGLEFGSRYFWRIVTHWADESDTCRYWYFCTRFRRMTTIDERDAGLSGSVFTSAGTDQSGSIWAGSLSDGVVAFDSTGKAVSYLGPTAQVVGNLGNDTLCIAAGTTLYKTQGTDSKPQAIGMVLDTTAGVVYPIVDAAETDDGELWLAAADGMRRWRGNGDTCRAYIGGLGGTPLAVGVGAQSLDTASILHVVAGTDTGLYVLIDTMRYKVDILYDTSWIPADTVVELAGADTTIDSVQRVECDSADNCDTLDWQFFREAGIDTIFDTTFHPDTIDTLWRMVELPGGIHSVEVIRSVPDGLWIGTTAGHLLRYQGGSWTLYEEQLRPYPVTGIAVAPDGAVWIGQSGRGGGGVSRFIPGTGWRHYNVDNCALPDSHVGGVAVDNDGTVWAATEAGLFMFQP